MRSNGHQQSKTSIPTPSHTRDVAATDAVTDQSLRLLFSSNPHPMVVLDTKQRIQMCNPAFENLFQYREEDIRGAELDSLLAPGELMCEAQGFTERAAAGEVIRASSQGRRRDGSLVEVQITCVPLVENEGAIGSFAIYEDITERREAQRAQQQAEEKLSQLFENAVEGIFRVGGGSAVERESRARAHVRLLVTRGNDCQNSGHRSRIYADPQAREEFKRIMLERGSVEGFEYQVRRKDGGGSGFRKIARGARFERRNLAYEGTMEDITRAKTY